MMRKLMVVALAGLFSVGMMAPVSVAHAKPKGKAKSAKNVDEDAPLDVVMAPTGAAGLDRVFQKAEKPIETVATIDGDVRGLKTNLVSALGLKDGTPFNDALNDLVAKGAGKIDMSLNDKQWPSFKAADGCPESVKPAIQSLNDGFGKLNGSKLKLTEAGGQLMGVVEEAADLISEPDKLGLTAMKTPKAVMTSKKNIKNLKVGGEVAKSLTTEMVTLLADVKSAFVAAPASE